jgi:pilus assembly protein Flp/PilA
MLNKLTALWKDEDGPTTVEYALMLVLVSVVAIAAWGTLGRNVSTQADSVATTVANGAPAAP